MDMGINDGSINEFKESRIAGNEDKNQLMSFHFG